MSNLSSPRYTAGTAYQHQMRRQTRPDVSDTDDLKGEYEKALSYIETLKSEQSSLKNSLRLALCDPNSNYPQDANSHRQSYHSNDFLSPRTMENRMNELEQENQELKALLGTNSTRMTRMQKDQHEYLEKVNENEALQAEIKELKTELNCLNKEFCTITNKLLEVEVRNADLLSQSLRNNQDLQGVEKTSILKYASYIHQLINSADKNHFSYCCFEERFSKGSDFFNLMKSDNQTSILLKAFKYITDLLININSQYYTSLTSAKENLKYDYLESNNVSCISEEFPDRNLIQKMDTPRQYGGLSPDETPVAKIVGMLERKSQRERENAIKNEEVRSPLKNAALKGLSLDLREQGNFAKMNGIVLSSARYSQDGEPYSASIRERMEDRNARSIESSPKRVQFKIDDDKFVVEEDLSEYTGIEDSRQRDRDDNKSDGGSDASENHDLVSRYKKELRERCKAIKETGKADNKSKSNRFATKAITEMSYEQPEESNVSYSTRSRGQKGDSVLDSSSTSKLKSYLKEGKESLLGEKSSKGKIQKNEKGHSRNNPSGDMSESYHINPKLRDYQVPTENTKKSALKSRDKTGSATRTRETSGTRFTPVLSPRVKSPKSSMTYQQINAARKSRASIEEGSSSKLLRKQNTSTSMDRSKVTDYGSTSISFWKNESRNKCSPSPTAKVSSIKDITKKKRVDSYPKQTYDVIRGQEIERKKM